MRLKAVTDGVDTHEELVLTTDDHHPHASAVAIENTSQVIGAGADYDLDITLPHGDFQVARVIIMGAKQMQGGQWREACEVHVTRDADEAIGNSVENVSFKKVYAVTYSKQNADTYLSHKIFDSNTSQQYILLKDAVITGSVLRLTFNNPTGTSATLWVKGQALVF